MRGNGKENLDPDVVNQTVDEISENWLIRQFSEQRLLSNVISSDSDLPTEDFWGLRKLRKSSGLSKKTPEIFGFIEDLKTIMHLQ